MIIKLRITGITKMKDDRICISGYDSITQKYYRPILEAGGLTSSFLNQYNPKISIFSLVTFTVIDSNIEPQKPHIEDIIVSKESIMVENDMISIFDQNDFLKSISDNSIEDVFGDFIEVHDDHYVVLDECGKRSLGTIICQNCNVYKDANNNVRVNLIDQTGFELTNVKCVSYDDSAKIQEIVFLSFLDRWEPSIPRTIPQQIEKTHDFSWRTYPSEAC